MQAISRSSDLPNSDSSAGERAAVKAEAPYPWIMTPVVDILFSCGGFLWIMAFLKLGIGSSDWSSPSAQFVWYFTIIGNLLLANAHAPATLYRVYTNPKLYKTIGRESNVLAVVFLITMIGALLNPTFAIVLWKIFMFWIIQHYLAQSYGITLLYCIKRGYYLNNNEKRLLHWLFNCTLIYAVLAMSTYKEIGSFTFQGLELPFWGPIPEQIFLTWRVVLQLSVVAFAVVILRKYIREKKQFPFPALLTLTTAVVLYATLSAYNPIYMLLLPAFLHGSQYLVITGAYYIKEQNLLKGESFHKIATKMSTPSFAKWFAIIFGIGLFTWVFLPGLLMKFGFAYGLILISIQASHGFHHFILDMFIWRMRDPELRKLLVA